MFNETVKQIITLLVMSVLYISAVFMLFTWGVDNLTEPNTETNTLGIIYIVLTFIVGIIGINHVGTKALEFLNN